MPLSTINHMFERAVWAKSPSQFLSVLKQVKYVDLSIRTLTRNFSLNRGTLIRTGITCKKILL